jgi:hypothetical protein
VVAKQTDGAIDCLKNNSSNELATGNWQLAIFTVIMVSVLEKIITVSSSTTKAPFEVKPSSPEKSLEL